MASMVSALKSSDTTALAPASAEAAAPVPAIGQNTEGHAGVFISAESLTFPTATALCAALVSSLKLFIGGAAENVWWVLGVSAVMGGLIIIMGWPPREKKGRRTADDRKRATVYAATGVLNILLLFASVMGIISISTQQVPTLPPPP